MSSVVWFPAKTAACVLTCIIVFIDCVLDSRKDCGLCFVTFYLYWETTKTVAQNTAKTAACNQKA